MKRILLVLSLLGIIVFSSVTTSNTSLSQTADLVSGREPKEIIIDAQMQINLVMIGDTWSDADKGNITSKLLKTYTPTIFFENRTAGVTYNYTYNFDSVSEETADKLFKFIDSVAVENAIPPLIKQWVDSKEPGFWGLEIFTIAKKKYKMISVYQVEDWIFNNLERMEGYTIYFLKPSNEQINYFHTYGSVTRDPDTGIDFIQEGMMGFGGTYRFYFIDLTAGPWLYPYLPISENQAIAQFHKNIYDTGTEQEYHELIARYVNDAITLLFTPSYIYSPTYKLNHKLDVVLIDMTSGRAFHDVAGKFINRRTIEQAFMQLIPYAEWTSDISGQSFDALPRELQRAILKSLTFRDVGGRDIVLVKSEDLITELSKWVTKTLTQEELQLAQQEASRTVFITMVLFVFDTDAYVDKEPVVGAAVPDPADKSVPCCAIVAVDKHALFDLGTGLSTLAIHEMGHVLGLRHPHDGYSSINGEFNNWFFDWSYTPMSYASPTSLGCGLPDEPCGLVVSEFGQFNFDSIDRGLVLYLLDQTQRNIYNSMLQLQEKGYNTGNLPADIAESLASIEQGVQTAKENFVNMSYFNRQTFGKTMNPMETTDDAFDFTLGAFTASEAFVTAVNFMPSLEEQPSKVQPEVSISMKLSAKQKKELVMLVAKNDRGSNGSVYGIGVNTGDADVTAFRAPKGWEPHRTASNEIVFTTKDPIDPGEKVKIKLKVDLESITINWVSYDNEMNVVSNGTTKPFLIKQRT